jgi:hypothetical protein
MGSFGTSTAGTDVFEFAVGAVGPKGDTGAQGRSGLTAPLARAAISPSSKTGTRLSTRIPAQRTVDGAESGCRPPAGRYFKSRLLHRGIDSPPQRHPAMLCDGGPRAAVFCLPAPMRRRPREARGGPADHGAWAASLRPAPICAGRAAAAAPLLPRRISPFAPGSPLHPAKAK